MSDRSQVRLLEKTSGFSDESSRWAAVVARDKAADDVFFYSVLTTGVYCRPSCAARLARRENVAFYDSCAAAEKAGFRPCKRCRPNEEKREVRQAQAVEKACRLIAEAEELPDLEALAEVAGMSRFHFHRVFKQLVGVTPKAYASAQRAERVRAELQQGGSITEAIYDSGFNSNGRFYANTGKLLGMKPSTYRKGGEQMEIRFALGECSLGSILVAASEKGLCAISLGDDPEVLVHELQDRFAKATLRGGEGAFEQWVAQVIGFVDDPRVGLDLPLDIRGTAFQQRVWQALSEIPLGTRVSYSEVAEKIGAPKAVRAVASACAANHLAVAIPCHRVVRNDGALSGYRWGIERKRSLLEREAGTAA
ncbi:bifunctional DNA-binding transcriptional regulator/O6-methylguanine-DNA methyltransferase Ada [Kiloniella laminariae]|uniref:Bifunctional DNA-binding transcriptional regulator/O6-methylguanine-DNA methyltransferase Ada n=1 Tax=Kiloniella laminariae TaxID=454162 RepID=A0ABT4LEH1_9PROT|nr:bifunctional DNA-binding transcriptional regulator/O6-methylguanine-DNA methyltransferase Ada [Kiloniella laminariae]MCZ4279489.1 bifunctional DNA-binding transcriptional regulator/O6-methylguanine-DNA methyltransferase Ada [Kiloniella laminariae]